MLFAAEFVVRVRGDGARHQHRGDLRRGDPGHAAVPGDRRVPGRQLRHPAARGAARRAARHGHRPAARAVGGDASAASPGSPCCCPRRCRGTGCPPGPQTPRNPAGPARAPEPVTAPSRGARSGAGRLAGRSSPYGRPSRFQLHEMSGVIRMYAPETELAGPLDQLGRAVDPQEPRRPRVGGHQVVDDQRDLGLARLDVEELPGPLGRLAADVEVGPVELEAHRGHVRLPVRRRRWRSWPAAATSGRRPLPR